MLANELSQQGLLKQPLCSEGTIPVPLPPLAVSELGYHSQEDPTLASAHPATTPVKGLTGTGALLPYQRAVLFASCQMLMQLFARAIIAIFFLLKIFLFHLEVLLLPQSSEKQVSFLSAGMS